MRNGFTWVELLVIIAVIVIIAGMLMPARPIRRRYAAYLAKCTNNLKQIGVGLELFAADRGGKFPLEVSAKEAGDALEGDTLPVNMDRTTGKLSYTDTFTVPDSSTGVAADERPSTFFQAQALLFARLYGNGNDWSMSGGSGVITDVWVFECPLIGERGGITTTLPEETHNFDILIDDTQKTGNKNPLYGANVKISGASLPNAISAADAARDAGDTVRDGLNEEVRKGINHNVLESRYRGFNYLYRDGSARRVQTYVSSTKKNILPESSSPESDILSDEALDAARPKDVEMITLF